MTQGLFPTGQNGIETNQIDMSQAQVESANLGDIVNHVQQRLQRVLLSADSTYTNQSCS